MDANRLYFAVGSFGEDPQVVSALLGLAPTEIWERGRPRPGRVDGFVKHERWKLDSPLPETEPFERHLEALIAQLETCADGVREAASRFRARLVCYSHFHTWNPEFDISADQIRRIAALGLSFEFDLYFTDDDDPEPDAVARATV